MRTTLALGALVMLTMLPRLARVGTGTESQPAAAPTERSVSAGPAAPAGCGGGPFAGDAVVAVVKEVDDEKATFGHPPRVKLEIVEVLRGDPNADRTGAVWGPPDHGIDTGVVEESPHYKEWAQRPMKGPTVGEKYVLWGWAYVQKGKPVFLAHDGGRFAFSDKERQRAVQIIHGDQKQALEYQRKMEAQRQAHQDAVRKWRQGVSSEDIKRYAAMAEFVGVGRRGSDSFRITRILKGTQKKEFTDGAYYVCVEIPQDVDKLLDRDTEYVVFLQNTASMLSAAGANYARIPLGDGVVIADEQAMKALAGFAGRKPSTASMPAASQPLKPA